MPRKTPAEKFEPVSLALKNALDSLPGDRDESRIKDLRKLAGEIRHYLSTGKVLQDYKDMALSERPDCQNNGWGALEMATFVRERDQNKIKVNPHPASTISQKMLRPMLLSIAPRVCKAELANLKRLAVPKKSTGGFARLKAAGYRDELRQLIMTLKGLKKIKRSSAVNYLQAKGLPLMDEFSKVRRPYLTAARRIRLFAGQAKRFALPMDIVALHFIADTLAAIAPDEQIPILDRCACCHRHVLMHVWKGEDRRSADNARARGRLCLRHQTRRKGSVRDFSNYSQAYRLKDGFVRAVNDVDHVFFTLAQADAPFREAAYFIGHWDTDGNPLKPALEGFALHAPLSPEVRQQLLSCVSKVSDNNWPLFLLAWYQKVDDTTAADQIRALITQNKRKRGKYQPPSIEAGDMEDAPAEIDDDPHPNPAPLAVYRPEIFIDDLIRYEANCQLTAQATKFGRPEVALDERRVLELAQAGKSTRAISQELKVSAEKIRLLLKAQAAADQCGVPLATVKALQRDILRAKQKGLKGYTPDGKLFKLSAKQTRAIAEAL